MNTLSTRARELNELVQHGTPIANYENRGDPVHGGFAVPLSHLTEPPMRRRDMQAGNFSQGGALVETEVDEVINFLNPVSAVVRMKPDIRVGGKGNVVLPTVTGTVNAEFLSEYQAATPSDLTTGQLSFLPTRLAVSVTASKELAIQANVGRALFWLIAEKIGSATDAACLTGPNGASPIGLLNFNGVGSVTFNSSVWANLCAFEAAVGNASANVDSARFGWITTPNVRSYFKQTQRSSTSSFYLMNDANEICGYRSEMTTALSGTDQVVFGNWADYTLQYWGDSIYFRVNPFTKSPQGLDIYDAWCYVDFGPRHQQSFVISTGSPL